MSKYLICDLARSDWGKTQTLLKVIYLIKTKTKPLVEEVIDDVDKFAIFKINGKKIIVSTQGDPNSYQKEGLLRAVNDNADIIVCASRTKGYTANNIYETTNGNYEIILFNNFYADNKDLSCIPSLKNISAEAIVNLLLTII